MTDTNKLQSVVAYIAGRVQPGKVKLFKLMYLADFSARADLGRPITGDTYENFEMGPVPVTLWKQFDEITRDCVNLTRVETGVIPEQQMTPRPEFHPNLDEDEKRILDRVIDTFGSWSGNRLRDYTHKTIPYLATGRGDTIPYGLAAYLNYKRPTQDDLAKLLSDKRLVAELSEALHRAS